MNIKNTTTVSQEDLDQLLQRILRREGCLRMFENMAPEKVAELLCAKAVTPATATDNNLQKTTLIHYAIARNNTEVLQAILSAASDTKVQEILLAGKDNDEITSGISALYALQDEDNLTPLQLAAREANVETMHALLNTINDTAATKSLVFARDEQGNTLLHTALTARNTASTYAILIAIQPDDLQKIVLKANDAGETPMYLAHRLDLEPVKQAFAQIESEFADTPISAIMQSERTKGLIDRVDIDIEEHEQKIENTMQTLTNFSHRLPNITSKQENLMYFGSLVAAISGLTAIGVGIAFAAGALTSTVAIPVIAACIGITICSAIITSVYKHYVQSNLQQAEITR